MEFFLKPAQRFLEKHPMTCLRNENPSCVDVARAIIVAVWIVIACLPCFVIYVRFKLWFDHYDALEKTLAAAAAVGRAASTDRGAKKKKNDAADAGAGVERGVRRQGPRRQGPDGDHGRQEHHPENAAAPRARRGRHVRRRVRGRGRVAARRVRVRGPDGRRLGPGDRDAPASRNTSYGKKRTPAVGRPRRRRRRRVALRLPGPRGRGPVPVSTLTERSRERILVRRRDLESR